MICILSFEVKIIYESVMYMEFHNNSVVIIIIECQNFMQNKHSWHFLTLLSQQDCVTGNT